MQQRWLLAEHIQVNNVDDPDDEQLEEALSQCGKHVPDTELTTFLACQGGDAEPKELIKLLAEGETYSGQNKNDVYLKILHWCSELRFSDSYPDTWSLRL